MGGGVEGAGFLGGFDYDHDVGKAGDEAVAMEEGGLRLRCALALFVVVFAWG